LRIAESDAGFAALIRCKICGAMSAPLYGTVDFNRNCEIPGAVNAAALRHAGALRRCRACGFLFTDAFDGWSQDDFRTHIYNDGYAAVDPDYAESPAAQQCGRRDHVVRRAEKRAAPARLWRAAMTRLCAQCGRRDSLSPSPTIRSSRIFATRPDGRFDLVTCFETLEHMPDPVAGIGDIVAQLDEPGLVLFSTLLQPRTSTSSDGLVVCRPAQRAHFLFSRTALAKAWGRHGFRTHRSTTTCTWHSARCGFREASGERLRPFPVMAGAPPPSWPGLSRSSTSWLCKVVKTWMPGTRPGMTLCRWQRIPAS
jgi:2-polyprenyl-6-hydroxyphenyl methylase/3-demethylubiquinone-9 3-methyltransferase